MTIILPRRILVTCMFVAGQPAQPPPPPPLSTFSFNVSSTACQQSEGGGRRLQSEGASPRRTLLLTCPSGSPFTLLVMVRVNGDLNLTSESLRAVPSLGVGRSSDDIRVCVPTLESKVAQVAEQGSSGAAVLAYECVLEIHENILYNVVFGNATHTLPASPAVTILTPLPTVSEVVPSTVYMGDGGEDEDGGETVTVTIVGTGFGSSDPTSRLFAGWLHLKKFQAPQTPFAGLLSTSTGEGRDVNRTSMDQRCFEMGNGCYAYTPCSEPRWLSSTAIECTVTPRTLRTVSVWPHVVVLNREASTAEHAALRSAPPQLLGPFAFAREDGALVVLNVDRTSWPSALSDGLPCNSELNGPDEILCSETTSSACTEAHIQCTRQGKDVEPVSATIQVRQLDSSEQGYSEQRYTVTKSSLGSARAGVAWLKPQVNEKLRAPEELGCSATGSLEGSFVSNTMIGTPPYINYEQSRWSNEVDNKRLAVFADVRCTDASAAETTCPHAVTLFQNGKLPILPQGICDPNVVIDDSGDSAAGRRQLCSPFPLCSTRINAGPWEWSRCNAWGDRTGNYSRKDGCDCVSTANTYSQTPIRAPTPIADPDCFLEPYSAPFQTSCGGGEVCSTDGMCTGVPVCFAGIKTSTVNAKLTNSGLEVEVWLAVPALSGFPVTVHASVSEGDLCVTPSTLVFTSETWNQKQRLGVLWKGGQRGPQSESGQLKIELTACDKPFYTGPSTTDYARDNTDLLAEKVKVGCVDAAQYSADDIGAFRDNKGNAGDLRGCSLGQGVSVDACNLRSNAMPDPFGCES